MCGRYILNGSWAEAYDMYNLIRPEDAKRNVPARYNIAPTQDVLFVLRTDKGQVLNEGRWWLVPHWAKEIPKYPMINARSETVTTKSSFRGGIKNRRCLIPADGYYEWTKNEGDGKKDPWCITLPNWEPFAFAGIWAHNKTLNITSCTIITMPADPAIEHIHERMPVILNRMDFDMWLDASVLANDALAMLENNRGNELQA